MSNRVRIILIISVIVLLGLGAVAVWYFYSRTPEPTTNGNVNVPENVNANTNEPANNNQPVNNGNVNTGNTNEGPQTGESEEDEEEMVLRLARIFTERYGTFSNRNNFENITNLEPFMTEKLRRESAEFISANQEGGVPEEFYGITTTVKSLEIVEFSSGERAVVVVGTQRIETKGSNDPKSFQQEATLEFLNVDGDWKVNAISFK
jgi:hypothetical protein